MKKVTLCCAVLFTGAVFAQQSSGPANSLTGHFLSMESQQTQPLKSYAPINNLPSMLQSGLSSTIFSWAEARWAYDTTTLKMSPSKDFIEEFFTPVFMDSTAVYYNSSSNPAQHVQFSRLGLVIDPKSPVYKNHLSSSQSFTIDTIQVLGNYQRTVNTNDTLVVDVVWGDTTQTNLFTSFGLGSGPEADISWYLPHFKTTASNGDVAYLDAPASNHKKISYILKSTDAASSPVAISNILVSTGGISIPAGNIVAVTFTFAPGSEYVKGDNIYCPAGTANASNGFSALTLQGNSNYAYNYFYDISGEHKSCTLLEFEVQRYNKLAGTGDAPFDTIFANPLLSSGADFTYFIALGVTYQSTGIQEAQSNNLHVSQNMPNPFSDRTQVGYELAEASNVSLSIYDVTGKRIQVLDQGMKMPGSYTIQVNSSDLQAGMYFYTLSTGKYQVTKRMTVIR